MRYFWFHRYNVSLDSNKFCHCPTDCERTLYPAQTSTLMLRDKDCFDRELFKAATLGINSIGEQKLVEIGYPS